MSIGGMNHEKHMENSTIQEMSYFPNNNQYKVRLERIEVNGDVIGIKSDELNAGQGVFFDSGTTSFHGPPPIIE